ncbi:MAG: hypothetical protein KAQ79_16270, partial [Cyclobacteriaceae bacterium]|nr:hypothetical protein [Cyclobacteriaceae bacterium]
MIFFSYLKYHSYIIQQSGALCIGLVVGLLITISACDSTNSVTPYQEQIFIKLYGGNGSEEGKDLLLLPDGGFVLVGSSTSESNGGKDVYIVRTDNIGNVIWENSFGNLGDDIGNSVILGQNNSLYVCGELTQVIQDTILIDGLRDVYILNLNLNDGTLIGVSKQYGDSIRDEFGTDIIELNNGGFLITSTWDTSDTSKFFMVETDENLIALPKRSRYVGKQGVQNISTKSFENPGNPINPFICFGSLNSTPSDQIPITFWFQSFNYRSDGNQTPAPELYGNSDADDFCTDVFMTIDGGYVLSGYTLRGGNSREIVIKLNSNLAEVWTFAYDNEFGRDVKETGIVQTSDGGYIVSSTIELDDPANDEISLLKLNFAGEEEWRNTYGSNDNDIGSKVIQL